MGPVSSDDLVAAVAEAGGLGTFTALGLSAAQISERLDALAKATTGAFGANFLTGEVDREAVVVAGEKARVVDFFWNDPDASLVELAHRGGAVVSWQVGSVAEAKAAADAGADVVIAQGIEAGGHVRGETALLPLLGRVLDAVDVPVLAAGGIASARTLAAVLAAGAAGARIGTRFIATRESGAHPRYVEELIRAADTEITSAYSVMCPLCATVPRVRVLSSALRAALSLEVETAGELPMGGENVALPKFAGLPPPRSVTGHVEAMALYAGQSAGAVNEVKAVSEVVKELVEGAERLLGGW